ncbi:hypothetical protein KC19_2G121500 [Ceratodon purpureus]|uniref:Protein kinase domain-containing protein n=1 Tax=Ceratodon purpureus TaxID=3225 RepID=A0A8T0IV59_CERPU|nr:hypothetical protein KC19_2G121500 [Ceratodon purpureus]
MRIGTRARQNWGRTWLVGDRYLTTWRHPTSPVHASKSRGRVCSVIVFYCLLPQDSFTNNTTTLTDASLKGSLPAAIGNLTSLVSLTITGNKDLTGRLPPQLQHLNYNLNILNLRGNGFNGSIPAIFTYLRQLQQLDLSANQFDGPLQVDFRNLTWLRTLNLSRNLLIGNIKLEYLQGLGQLITLDLSSNRFTGPLFDLTKSPFLNTLNLSFNSFNGDVRLSNILNDTSSQNLRVVDLSNNSLTGLIPDFSAWTNLTVLDLSYNPFQAALFPVWLTNLSESLQVLRLKGNNLTGPIPNQVLQNFQHLRMLELDNNHFSGTIDIGEVIRLSRLEFLSLKNNNVTEVLHNGPSLKAIERYGINLYGNPYCYDQTSNQYLQQCVCLQVCIDPEIVPDSKKNSIAVIAPSVAASVLAIIILVMGLVFWKTRREKQKLQLQVQQHFAENDVKPTIFTFNQLRSATEDFSERMKIGQGSFGAVYKGYLHENANPVAVKQLFIKNQQSITEFLNEVVVVTAIKHRNLVNLKGCCIREDQRLLVYEYLDNNDLAHHLFHQRGGQQLTWPTRFNICLGVARGLHYLHASAQPRIIHRDIKASNVLMDRELQPKIADFGLALFFPDEQTHIITSDIAGTRGYWAPEYATMGQLSEKADVYSFGVLLLEVVSGRKNLDYNMPQHKVYLCQWGRELFNNSNVMELVDPALSLSKDEETEVRRIINIALLCLQVEPERRPTMGAVVATLEGSFMNLEAEGMRHLTLKAKPPSTSASLAHLYEHPRQDAAESPLFSSETTGSSSMISLASIGNYSGFGSDSTQLRTLPGAPRM